MKKSFKIFCIISCVIFTFFLIFAIVFAIHSNYYFEENKMYKIVSADIEFSPERWNKETYNRRHMVNDFENKYDLSKLSKAEFVDLLGTNSCAQNEDSLEYVAGHDDFWGFSWYYKIYFEDGLYSESILISD